jgi:hypothetical protein
MMVKLRGLALINLVLFLSSACSVRGVLLKNHNRSLRELRQAVVAIAGEPRQVSENQREIYSDYFPREKTPDFNPSQAKERLFAKFTILGDRRPYDIIVEVYPEELEGTKFVRRSLDLEMSKQIARELRRYLVESPADRSILDSFRPF